jgi:hypothetical protein
MNRGEDFVIRMRDTLAQARAELERFERGADDDLPIALVLALTTPCRHEGTDDHVDFQRIYSSTNKDELDYLYEALELDASGELFL